ncbi:MAG: glycosyltransferase family 4 protein [Planctomycetaceae bacterium]
MKITCIIHSLAGGGAERVMAGLVTRLSERGHQVTLLTLDNGQQNRYPVAAGVRQVALDVMSDSRSKLAAVANTLRRCRALRSAIESSHPDVVLSFCDATNVLTLLATLGSKTPVIVSERSDPAQQCLAWPWSFLRPRLYRRAREIIVLTDAAAKTVSPWCPRPPVVIASAIDPPPALERPRLAISGQRHLVGIGRLEREKGFDRLINAFANVATLHPQWQLRIVGEGSCREQLERQVESLGLRSRVCFTGWVKPIWPSLEDADLFALTSRYEGFPSALMEAMAAGVAIIAVDCDSGPRAIVRDNVDGLLIANSDEAIAVALDRCMGDAALREHLGREAVHVTARFGWEAMVDAYERRLTAAADGLSER